MSEDGAETFPPCWRCEHPMLSEPAPHWVSCHICPSCTAAVIVPRAYAQVVQMNIGMVESVPATFKHGAVTRVDYDDD